MAGNPVALSAGLATLEILRTGAPYQTLQKLGKAFDAAVAKFPAGPRWRRVGSIVWPYFDPAGEIPSTAEGISKAAIEKFRAPYRSWLDKGIYFPPSAYEVGFFRRELRTTIERGNVSSPSSSRMRAPSGVRSFIFDGSIPWRSTSSP